MDKPNILLIVSDSARLDRCSCYGYGRPTTPVLDEVAAEGVRYTSAYSESSWTVPAMFTLLTGLAPREHRGEAVRRLVGEMPTLPELLKGAGYSTYGGSANPFFGPKCGVTRGFDHFHRPARAIRVLKPFMKYVAQRLGWTDNGGQSLTEQFIRALPDLRPPWFAVLWYFDVHSPYAAKEPYTDQFARKPLSLGARNRLLSRLRTPPELVATASDDELVQLSDLYDAAMAYEDMLVGRLREALRSHGAWKDTLTIFTADHGEMLGERGLAGHGRSADMYEPILHIPLVVRGPGLPGTGAVSDSLVQLADVTEGIARAAGVKEQLPPTSADRIGLLGAATGQGRPHAISEREPFNERSARTFQKRNPSVDVRAFLHDVAVVVRDGWKLIDRSDGRRELYHVAEDATEQDDLAASHSALVEDLAQIAIDWREHARPHASVDGLAADEEAIVEKRLQDLGYF